MNRRAFLRKVASGATVEQDNAPGTLPDPPGSSGPAAGKCRAIRELRG